VEEGLWEGVMLSVASADGDGIALSVALGWSDGFAVPLGSVTLLLQAASENRAAAHISTASILLM
jgi:hypothetical protein